MKVKPQTAILVTLLLFVLGIAITSAFGIWTTKSSKIPARLKDVPDSSTYNQSGAPIYDPSDIRGSYTFSEISTLYQIPLEDLAAAFGVAEDAASSFKCKDLELIYGASQYEIGTGSVRLFTAYYLGLPYDPTEETYLPDAAVKILMEKGNLTQEQRDDLEAHAIPAP